MLRIVLGLSLVVNGVLAFLLLRKEEAPRMEKIIIETHAEKKEETQELKLKAQAPRRFRAPTTTEAPEEELEPFAVPVTADEMSHTHERMESERTDYLVHELGLSQETLQEYQRLRNGYFEQTSEMWKGNPYGELSFKARRKMLELEEKLHADLEELFGKQNWERYRTFRENYNRRGFERQVEENQPFLFMGL